MSLGRKTRQRGKELLANQSSMNKLYSGLKASRCEAVSSPHHTSPVLQPGGLSFGRQLLLIKQEELCNEFLENLSHLQKAVTWKGLAAGSSLQQCTRIGSLGHQRGARHVNNLVINYSGP